MQEEDYNSEPTIKMSSELQDLIELIRSKVQTSGISPSDWQAVNELIQWLEQSRQPLNYGFIKDLAPFESETFVDALKKIAKLSGKSEKGSRYGLWKPTRDDRGQATKFDVDIVDIVDIKDVDIKSVDSSQPLNEQSILIPVGLLPCKDPAQTTTTFHLETQWQPKSATILSLAFDGKKDYIEIKASDTQIINNFDDINFQTEQEFTVEVWVKVASLQLDVQYGDNSIVEKWDAVSNTYPFAIRYENTTGRIVAIRFEERAQEKNQPILKSKTNINDGKFHHIAFVKLFNPSNQGEGTDEEKKPGLHLYIDGKHEAFEEDTTKDSTNGKVPLYLACRAGTRNYFRGQIGEVAIWNKGLAKSEIEKRIQGYKVSEQDQQPYTLKNQIKDSDSNLVVFISPELILFNQHTFHGTLSLIEFEHWSAVKNQGALQSCTVNAVTSLLEYFQHQASRNSEDISRLFIYKATRNLMGLEIETPPGASIRQTLAAIELLGALPEKYWPYHPFLVDQEPFNFCYDLAKNYRLTAYCRLDRPGMNELDLLDQVKVFIMAGLPPMFGFPLNSSVARAARFKGLNDPAPEGDIQFDYFDPDSQGHAVIAVGYDDTRKIICNLNPNPQFQAKVDQLIQYGVIKTIPDENENKISYTIGALKIRNSWGREWGTNGYGWLPYAYVLAGLTVDWWSILKTDWFNTEYFGQSLRTDWGNPPSGGGTGGSVSRR